MLPLISAADAQVVLYEWLPEVVESSRVPPPPPEKKKSRIARGTRGPIRHHWEQNWLPRSMCNGRLLSARARVNMGLLERLEVYSYFQQKTTCCTTTTTMT